MSKIWHVIVLENYKKVILNKSCLNVKHANVLIEQLLEQYPSPKYKIIKDLY